MMNQKTDCPKQSDREIALEVRGYEKWLSQQEAKHDPLAVFLGPPPHAPTWALEIEGQRDFLSSEYGPRSGVLVIERPASGATVRISAERTVIELQG